MSETKVSDPTEATFAGPCPRCGGAVPSAEHKGEYPGALSRYDNETYICSDCGVQEAFGAGWLVPFSVGLHSEDARMMREEVSQHSGTMVSGEVICSCGWISGHFAMGTDANDCFRNHIANAAYANKGHNDERHSGGSLTDIKAWASLGCRACKEMTA